MNTERIHVKLFAKNAGHLELDPFVPVFHRWIREGVLDEQMIDVADYAHVHEGPGIVLVGHGSDYYIDLEKGRPGLLYSRKRAFEGSFGARLADALRRALAAGKLLEEDASVGNSFKLATNEILLRVPDRLNAPNTDATLAAVKPELEKVLGKLFGGAAFTIEREGTEREPFTVRVRTQNDDSVSTLLGRVSA